MNNDEQFQDNIMTLYWQLKSHQKDGKGIIKRKNYETNLLIKFGQDIEAQCFKFSELTEEEKLEDVWREFKARNND